MARRRREINVFSLSFLDLISGALGAVIILYVAVPKANPERAQLQEIQAQMVKRDQLIQDLKRQASTTSTLEEALRQAQAESESLRQQLASMSPPAEAKPDDTAGPSYDVGFKFKGRGIVFIIDTSRSMLDEDRMGQVKAGLKMLITSMPSNYTVDIVQFPYGSRTPYRPLYGKLQGLSSLIKGEIFDFIYELKPDGATPTRDVMNYVFRTYRDLTDVVLLTDGEPSLHNSPMKDDIYELLNNIRKLNPGTKVQVNTIGVGETVLHDKTGRPYQFLKLLAEQNAGFFVGF